MTVQTAADTFAQGLAESRAALDADVSDLAPSGHESRIRQKLNRAVNLYESAMGLPADAEGYATVSLMDKTRTPDYLRAMVTKDYDEAALKAIPFVPNI